MKFRNLTTDDRWIAKVGVVEAGAEFDVPDGFDVASIAHQDIYEPADAEAEDAVKALLDEITDQATPHPEVVVDPKADAGDPAPTDPPADPPTPQENS